MKQCEYCEVYKDKGHNYCRICGYHVRKGLVKHARIASAFSTKEKYCGYCGSKKNNCDCK